jgi:Subtilase family
MRAIRLLIVIALVTSAIAASSAATAKSPKAKATGPAAVVAIVDTGINPYHVTFRDDSPQAYKHPSTYIPGYPKDAIAFELSFNEPDYWSAVKKDCKRWNEVETGKLYWFPGTKIVGAITFAPEGTLNCESQEPVAGGRILDAGGHGTMTASRATSTEYGACKECRVVAVQFSANGLNSEDALNSISWAGDNADWIDAQSNSWGPVAPLWEPTGAGRLMTSNPELVRRVEEVSRKHLAFWASGNGALFRWGVAGHPTPLASHFTPSAIMVGGHDSGYVTTWPGFPPHIVSDVCDCLSASHIELEESGEFGSGTSSATPFAAGGAVQILLEARTILGDSETGVSKDVVASGPKGIVKDGPLADGKFTLEEWKRVVYVSASPRPQGQKEDGSPCDLVEGLVLYSATPVKWSDVPEGYPEFLHIGYGAVDSEAMDLASAILQGKEQAPDRSTTDAYFGIDQTMREATYEVWSRP